MLPENYDKMEYKDLIKVPELRDGDSIFPVGISTVLMYSLYADYDEFSKAQTAKRFDATLKKGKLEFKQTKTVGTSEQHVVLEDGTEWYVAIIATYWEEGWSLKFKKRQGPSKLTKGKNQENTIRYGITENGRKVPLWREFDKNVAVDGSKCINEDLLSLSIDSSAPFSSGDYIKFCIEGVTEGPFVARVKRIQHSIWKSGATDGKDFFGYVENVGIYFENHLSKAVYGYDIGSIGAEELKSIEVVDEDAYKNYLNLENNLLQEQHFELVCRQVEKFNKQIHNEFNSLNPTQISDIAKQIVETYKNLILES